MARTLSDEAWADICAAAQRPPDGEARAALATLLLDEYPRFAYKRERVEADLLRSGRMLKQLAAFAELYREAWLPHLPADQFEAIRMGLADPFIPDDVKAENDLRCIAMLRRRPEAVWLRARAIRRANKGRKNEQREWLYHPLCGIWLDRFHARELTYTVLPLGGPPGGDLIEFMLAAMRQIMPGSNELPSTETLRNAIDRERKERDNVAQLRLDLRQRKVMGS